MIRVVHINHLPPDVDKADVLYCGRGDRFRGHKRSPYHNPFSIGEDGTRDEVIALFRSYAEKRPELVRSLRARLREDGKLIMGCHCKWPDPATPCHCDVWAELVMGEQA